MERFELEAEAGQVSQELVRLGISPQSRVHILVEVEDSDHLAMAAIAQAGGSFDWLADEPDLYSDSDVRKP